MLRLLLLVALASNGCATLFAPGPDRIPVSSNPPGARIFLDNQEVGTTPMTISLDRKLNYGSLRIEAPGYQPVALQRVKTFNTIAIINLFSPIHWIIDLVTGNYERFEGMPVNVTLVPYGGDPQAYPGQPYQQPQPYPPQYPQPPAPAQPPRYPPQPAPGWGTPPPGYPPQPAPAYPLPPGYPQQPYPQQPYPPPAPPPPPVRR